MLPAHISHLKAMMLPTKRPSRGGTVWHIYMREPGGVISQSVSKINCSGSTHGNSLSTVTLLQYPVVLLSLRVGAPCISPVLVLLSPTRTQDLRHSPYARQSGPRSSGLLFPTASVEKAYMQSPLFLCQPQKPKSRLGGKLLRARSVPEARKNSFARLRYSNLPDHRMTAACPLKYRHTMLDMQNPQPSVEVHARGVLLAQNQGCSQNSLWLRSYAGRIAFPCHDGGLGNV